jgi:ABC-2 type transport system permease protein
MNLQVYWLLMLASMRSRMQYKLDFFLELANVVVAYGAHVANTVFLVQRFEHIRGWTLGELVFLYALAVLAWGLAVLLFYRFAFVGEEIRRGDFDRYLLRPLNPFAFYMAARFELYSAGQFAFAVMALGWSVHYLDLRWTPGQVAFFVATVAGGSLIMGSLLIALGAISFWVGRHYLFWTFLMPARMLLAYPLSILPRVVQVVLSAVVPLAFVNYFPAHVFLGRPGGVLPWLSPLVGAVCFAAALFAWRAGLNRYQSTGS